MEITQLVGCEVEFEPDPSEFREMERSHTEGVGALAAQVLESSPVLSLIWRHPLLS